MTVRSGLNGPGRALRASGIRPVAVPLLAIVSALGSGVAPGATFPCRLVDTRVSAGPLGRPSLAAGAARILPLEGACDIAAASTSASVRITLLRASQNGSLFLWPEGSAQPSAPLVRYPARLPVATSLTLDLSRGRRLQVLADQRGGTTDLIVDVLAPPTSPPAGGALYLADLVPETGVSSAGAGTASILLAADRTSAVLSYSFENLTTALVGAHVHGPADPGQTGSILFDLDDLPPGPDGSFPWTFVPVGVTTVEQILTALDAGRLYLNLHSARYPSGEIRGHFRLATGSAVFIPPPDPPPLPPGPPTRRDAARFLTQATYGATVEDIDDVVSRGYAAWIDAQLALPVSSHLGYLDALGANGQSVCTDSLDESFWKQALTGPDQLRQRVILALSEILVVSAEDADLAGEPIALAYYLDVLSRNAFGSYRQLLRDLTLSPAMGVYLDMQGNDRENAAAGRIPNENYAREILQLFSVGLYRLHPDGKLVLDATGRPIPTYGQATVEGFAKVFTGWSFAGNPPDDDGWDYAKPEWRQPMVSWPAHHSPGSKALLGGTVLPAGGTAAQDLDAALDDIAAHPNVGPFLAYRLIQRLVTSNPSPGYVYRVARVFDDDGSGVRGNLGAVIRAILLDYEARSLTVVSQQGFGKQKEPIVRFGSILRAFHGAAASGRFRVGNLSDPVWALGQSPLHAPTVFGFFDPSYRPAGPLALAGLTGPEFQITTETQIIGAGNFLRGLSWGKYGDGEDEILLDLAPQLAAAASPQALVDQLDLLLFQGGMSAGLKSLLVGAVTELDPTPPEDRVQLALDLALVAPEWNIQK